MNIPTIELSGTPKEIGQQHGILLSEQIYNNIAFYRTLFLKIFDTDGEILAAAKNYRDQIHAFNPHYITEIDNIALAAGVTEPLWLYAMNARTELAMFKDFHECTAVVLPKQGLLAQNWDWAQNIAANVVMMHITFPNGHKISQVTEAGIIGKIGMNNHGLGVTLNILFNELPKPLAVPVHIVLRAVLDSPTLDQTIDAVQRSGHGKASNLIIAHAGAAVDIEFTGPSTIFHPVEEDVYVHTNHYRHADVPYVLDQDAELNTNTRCSTAINALNLPSSDPITHITQVLSDQSDKNYPILANYKKDSLGLLGKSGTLATIIMDLTNKKMLVRKGNPDAPGFSHDGFMEIQCD